MTYTIIGGDGKEYGFITPEDIRKWVAENRLNSQSLVKSEGDAEFRPLSTFPEFADIFSTGSVGAGAPPQFSAPAGNNATALQMVKAPAIALIVTAILSLLLSLYSLAQKLFFPPNLEQYNQLMQQINDPGTKQMMQSIMQFFNGPIGIVDALFGLAVSILLLWGAFRMMALRSYELALTVAILAMIPCISPCCLLGLPFGIWALVVLRNPVVKSNFH